MPLQATFKGPTTQYRQDSKGLFIDASETVKPGRVPYLRENIFRSCFFSGSLRGSGKSHMRRRAFMVIQLCNIHNLKVERYKS
jgi:hypothetical protein